MEQVAAQEGQSPVASPLDTARRLVVFDIDGCIADDEWRRAFIKGEGVTADDHVEYHRYASKDDPIPAGIQHLNAHVQNGDFIAFATARPMMIGQQTLEWIQKHSDLKQPNSCILLMRKDTDERDAVTLKREMATELKRYAAREGLELTCAYDDRPDVINMWLSEGFPAAILDKEGPGALMRPQDSSPHRDMEQAPHDAQEQHHAHAAGRHMIGGHVASVHAADALGLAIKTFLERQNTYGPNDIIYAKVMKTMFPGTVTLTTEQDHRAFLMMMHAVNKLTRFASSGMKHADSAHDNINYMAFLELLASEHNIVFTPGEIR